MVAGDPEPVEKRICFGCMAWKNDCKIPKIKSNDGEYVGHRVISPYRSEDGYIFACFQRDENPKDENYVYYLQNMSELSAYWTKELLKSSNKNINYDYWRRITRRFEKVNF